MIKTLTALIPFRPSARRIAVMKVAASAYDEGDRNGYARCLRDLGLAAAPSPVPAQPAA